MKYHLITYGCQMNTADSEEMAQPLKERGFIQTPDAEQADVIIMNTCTVRDQAEHRADSNLGRLRPWKDRNPNRILIVAGCAASRWGDSIQKKYSYIDAVSPATRIEEFPELIAKVLKERWNWGNETLENFSGSVISDNVVMKATKQPPATALPPYHPTTPSNDLFGTEATAYVTIMRGCNYTCSYCIVPRVRGREVYRPMPEILSEIERKVAKGYREVMLLGQTVNSYHYRADTKTSSPADVSGGSMDPGLLLAGMTPGGKALDFADLLHAVNAVSGIERIRFMSPHPRHMRPSVIQAMAASRKVAHHIHLPMQSGSNRLLAEMKRFYTRETYDGIVQNLRAWIPGILITTDIIVGYPGEKEADFQNTLEALHSIQFDGLFAFKFSPRPGTAAAEQIDDVPAGEKEDRLQQVLAFSKHLLPSREKEGMRESITSVLAPHPAPSPARGEGRSL